MKMIFSQAQPQPSPFINLALRGESGVLQVIYLKPAVCVPFQTSWK